MSDWFNVYDGVFFISITTIVIGFLGLTVRFCLKSKCGSINCCYGCLMVNRNVELEVQQELAQIENGHGHEHEHEHEHKEEEKI